MLEHSIYNTIRYFDLLDLPVTAVQIWQYLLADNSEKGVRWQGHVRYSLSEVRAVLDHSAWLKSKTDRQWGYFTLVGKRPLIRRRLRRHSLAQDKWKILQRSARLLAAVPFVRGLAGSGSLAIDNTSPTSDLDLLTIVRPDRIWTARLGLLVVSQLLGRRRKYWNEKAPDKLCLNHYLTEDSILIDSSIRNLYAAMMYAVLVPVYNAKAIQDFRDANDVWIRQYVMTMELPPAGHSYTVQLPKIVEFIKTQIERFLIELPGDFIEVGAKKIQLWQIRRHAHRGRAGRVVVSDIELAFHPDTKMPAILARFSQDPGQQSLI